MKKPANNRGERFAAKQRGDIHYFTGKPCIHGHITKRLTSSGVCCTCTVIKAAAGRKRRSPEKLEKDRAYSRSNAKAWREANPNHENTKIVKKRWKQENLGKVNANTAKRRSALLQRTPAWLSEDDWWIIEQAYELAALRTKLFKFQWHVDHIIPLQGKTVSGLHTPSNLQVIPWIDNLQKATRFNEAERH